MRKTAFLVAGLSLLAAGLTALGCGPSKSPDALEAPSLESHFPRLELSDAALCRAMSQPEPRRAGDPRLARRKVVISDLHLGPGSGQGRQFDGLEDFFAAAELTRLLAELGQRPTELIIAGDFIEFWQIEEALGELPPKPKQGPVLGASQAGSLAALDVAMAAHPDVFTALKAFLASGDHRIVIVVGNHDGDLAWPRVQLSIAAALGQKDLRKLAFVRDDYRDRGVYIAHGHLLDAANKSPPPLLDSAGTCRLSASWGLVFVAKFLGALEQRFPFIDNLYPESSALMWGIAAEPDVTEPLIAGYRFADMLLSQQSGALNLEALKAAALGVLGVPDAAPIGDDAWQSAWQRAGGSERVWSALSLLATDPEFAPLRSTLIKASAALPDLDAVTTVLAGIDLDLLRALKERVATDPLALAAEAVIAAEPTIKVVVYGHTHVPGGAVVAVRGGHYANSGTWTPIGRVAELKRQTVSWPQLSLSDTTQFPRRLPAVIIDYNGETPRPPHLIEAR